MDDAGAGKDEEVEVSVVETGIFYQARGKEAVSKRLKKTWSKGGHHSTGDDETNSLGRI